MAREANSELKTVNFSQLASVFLKFGDFNLCSEWGSGSTKLLNTNPIRIHNTG